jgi:medium-chain acyl-[acyl-carrier-protein] hydrolase
MNHSINNRWIVNYKFNPNARLRLFCFPYAGAGGQIFRGLQSFLSPVIDVCPVELPGRWSRIQEPLITDMQTLIEAIDEGLEDLLDLPFSLLGYSFGSTVAFEYARYLRRHRSLLPRHLVINAYGHPFFRRSSALYTLPDEELVEKLSTLYGGLEKEVLQDREMLKIVLPIMRADLQILATYSYQREEPLACPISVFGGEWDRTTSRMSLDAWRTETNMEFNLEIFAKTKHFFIKQFSNEFAAQVGKVLGVYPEVLSPVLIRRA